MSAPVRIHPRGPISTSISSLQGTVQRQAARFSRGTLTTRTPGGVFVRGRRAPVPVVVEEEPIIRWG